MLSASAITVALQTSVRLPLRLMSHAMGTMKMSCRPRLMIRV